MTGPRGLPGPVLSPNGCHDGTVEQSWTEDMVGCDSSARPDGGTLALPVRNAAALCSAGWHVCDVNEWGSRRAGTLSGANRYLRARMTCSGCTGDVIVDSSAAELCENTCGTTSYAFYVSPTMQDVACNPWQAGIDAGNLNRAAQTSNADVNVAKAMCIAFSGIQSGTVSITGTLCCR